MVQPGFISEALDASPRSIDYEVSRRLADLFPHRSIVEGDDCDFTLMDFVREGLCTIRAKEGVHGQSQSWWSRDRGVRERPKNVWYEIDWRGHELDVLLLDWNECGSHFWILADSKPLAESFFQAVCEHDPDYENEILVFDGGCWDASHGLFRESQESSLASLILPSTLKDQLTADLGRFFASRALYESLGLAWKRGLLLTGPPGNGKTLFIKAAAGQFRHPCIYVKSFKSERMTEETSIRRIFERARKIAPCLLVLEDLDALVNRENRSFLLNELDGFARNTGLLTLATTNHPERLDPALSDRPSRFDRTYHFPLPDAECRRAYLDRWLASIAERVSQPPDDATRATLVELTARFSFAYLQELCLSSLQALAGSDGTITLASALTDQAILLSQQVRSAGARGERPRKSSP